MAEFILVVVLFPFVTFFGMILNILIIFIIKNKDNQKELFKKENVPNTHRFYDLMIINSIFNASECFLMMFSLINVCLGTNSIFCSSIMEDDEAQYFKVIVIGHFSETLKTCSTLLTIAISFERYILVSNNESWFCKKFHSIQLYVLINNNKINNLSVDPLHIL